MRAVHCYHNLVIIEKGDNREGTNRDNVAHELYGASELPDGVRRLPTTHERPARHQR